MLAAKFDPDKLKFPCLVSPKIDGIRAIVDKGVVRSRSMKLIPNAYVQAMFGHDALNGIDGELVIADPTAPDCFRKTTSIIMSHNKPIDGIAFLVFDYIYGGDSYKDRIIKIKDLRHPNILHVQQRLVHNLKKLYELEEIHLSKGFEGSMIRDPHATYKYGRSTVKEGKLLKLKRFLDGEAEIIGVEELLHNNNEAKTNELGLTSRASCEENKVPAETMGALLVRDVKTGVEFSLGTGFTAAMRQDIWDTRPEIIGCFVKYKHLPIGEKDKPRHPVFLGFRDKIDMEVE